MAKNQVAKVTKAPPAPFKMEDDDKKLGGTLTPADMAIPFLKIIQALSPQMKRENSEYNKDARIGDLFLTSHNRLWPGDKGVEVIFCHYSRAFVEWRPMDVGGGMVATYLPDDPIVKGTPRGPKGEMILDNGNQLFETAYHSILVHVDDKWVPAVLTLKKTAFKHSKKLNTMLESLEVSDGEGHLREAPRWGYVFRVTTGQESGGGNSWERPLFQKLDPVDDALYQQGKNLAIASNRNAAQFAAADLAQSGARKHPDEF